MLRSFPEGYGVLRALARRRSNAEEIRPPATSDTWVIGGFSSNLKDALPWNVAYGKWGVVAH